VLPFATIGAHLSDLADAALAAALEVAYAAVCGDGAPRPGWPSSRWANAVREN
jgi:glutamate-ammonia-ligase adenylyltransferase